MEAIKKEDLVEDEIYRIEYHIRNRRWDKPRKCQLRYKRLNYDGRIIWMGRPGIGRWIFWDDEIKSITRVPPGKPKVTYFDKKEWL